MEAAGLVVGVAGLAGLFSSCLDAFNRIQCYQTFRTDSHILDTRFKVAKSRFERWGSSVGIEQSRLRPDHHSALDDKATSTLVMDVLDIIIKTICDAENMPSHRTLGSKLRQDEPAYHVTPGSRRRRLTWALWGKEGRVEQVELFEKLVQGLYNLVPPTIQETALPIKNTGPGCIDSPAVTLGHTWPCEIRQILARVESEIQAEVRRDLHSWLGHCSTNERYQDSLQERVDGTCNWILDRSSFQKWLSHGASVGPKLLWINGPAGFGKTILCAHITEHLLSSLGTPVVHFFFSSDSDSRKDPYMALRSWISQIVSRHEIAFEHVRQRLDSTSNPLATRATIITLFRQLLYVIPGCTFIADGLDECTYLENSSVSVAKFLHDVTSAITETNSRLLLVSRDEPEIRYALIDNRFKSFAEYKIVPEDVRSDTAAYSRSIVNRKLSRKSANVRSILCEAMADRCQGQFLWIKMQEKTLRNGMNTKQLQHAIENTPIGLDHLYDQSWTKIIQLREWEMKQAFALLRWTAFALRPLTVYEITEAALILNSEDLLLEDLPDAVDEDYINSEIIGLCGPLLEVKNDTGDTCPGRRTVHLPHFSVRQYILCRLPTPGWIQQSDRLQNSYERLQNSLLAKACLQYVGLTRVWEDVSPSSSPSLGVSFRKYAAMTWYKHANLGVHNEKEIDRLSIKFLSRNNPVWDSWRTLIDTEEVDRQDTNAETTPPGPLYYAIKLHLKDVALSLATDQNVNETSSLGRSALGIACSNGLVEIVDAFLKKGADITITDNKGWTPLVAASACGQVEVVKLLLEKGADSMTADKNGWTPVNMALFYGHIEVVERLLEEGADIRIADKNGWSSAVIASAGGHIKAVELLLKIGVNITAADTSGLTPLIAASAAGHAEVVKLLLKTGVDINTADTNRLTPLTAASAAGYAEVMKLLLEEGADIMDNGKSMPLIIASAKGHIEAMKLLLQEGADIHTAYNGRTPLIEASAGGHVEAVKLLLAKGADNTATNASRSMPLMMACDNGYIEIVKLLLDHGADITTPDNNGLTPLVIASAKGHIEIIQLLLNHGADITTPDNNGLTPLIIASAKGYIEVVQLLLEEEINSTTANNNILLSLVIALIKGHDQVIEQLLCAASAL